MICNFPVIVDKSKLLYLLSRKQKPCLIFPEIQLDGLEQFKKDYDFTVLHRSLISELDWYK